MLKAKCSWCQTIPIIIRSKHSYWLLFLNFVTFLFGMTKILSWQLFMLTQKFKQIFEVKPSLYFATFFYQNLLLNILQTQLTVISHKINGAYVKWVRTRMTLLCVKVKLVKFKGSILNAWGLKEILKANGFLSNKKQKKTIEAIKNS